jgi:hypothetical protein
MRSERPAKDVGVGSCDDGPLGALTIAWIEENLDMEKLAEA